MIATVLRREMNATFGRTRRCYSAGSSRRISWRCHTRRLARGCPGMRWPVSAGFAAAGGDVRGVAIAVLACGAGRHEGIVARRRGISAGAGCPEAPTACVGSRTGRSGASGVTTGVGALLLRRRPALAAHESQQQQRRTIVSSSGGIVCVAMTAMVDHLVSAAPCGSRVQHA